VALAGVRGHAPPVRASAAADRAQELQVWMGIAEKRVMLTEDRAIDERSADRGDEGSRGGRPPEPDP
jgi:hypothetical protein